MMRIAALRQCWPHVLIALLMLAADAPAMASDGTAIPDPSALTLMALGVLGVIVGRSNGRRPPRD